MFEDEEGNSCGWLGVKKSIERPESGEKGVHISSGK